MVSRPPKTFAWFCFSHFTYHKGWISPNVYIIPARTFFVGMLGIFYMSMKPLLTHLISASDCDCNNDCDCNGACAYAIPIPNPQTTPIVVVSPSTSQGAAVRPAFCLPCRATSHRMPRNMHLHILCIPTPRLHCAIARPCAPGRRCTPSHNVHIHPPAGLDQCAFFSFNARITNVMSCNNVVCTTYLARPSTSSSRRGGVRRSEGKGGWCILRAQSTRRIIE
jgi:hypothetical protein